MRQILIVSNPVFASGVGNPQTIPKPNGVGIVAVLLRQKSSKHVQQQGKKRFREEKLFSDSEREEEKDATCSPFLDTKEEKEQMDENEQRRRTESHMSQEHPSTYFIENRSSKDDLARLPILDRMLTAAMGGILPEQTDPSLFHSILDVGCGTGGWIIEAARQYPTIARLTGVDISSTIVSSARTQAELSQLGERVEFHVMDALRMLEFPSATFDLVNQRAGASYLRTWDWPKLLQE